jgi:hypothetical protein
MNIKAIAYDKYQLYWLISHGYTIKDISDLAEEWLQERLSNPSDSESFNDYLFVQGFSGSLWVCFEEFLNSEYLDEEYIKGLLNDLEYEEYKKDIKKED